MEELQKKLLQDIELLKKDEGLKEYLNQWDNWRYHHSKEFEKTLKSLKNIFKKEGLALPEDWNELFTSWLWSEPVGSKIREIMSSSPKDQKIFELNPIPKEYFIRWATEETQKLLAKDEAEKLKNLPHKLCLLDDLGILGLIEDRFSNKYYTGTRPQTDKARLIASLLEIDNPESVRQALKNKDYLSDLAKSNAVKTLREHGLEPKITFD